MSYPQALLTLSYAGPMSDVPKPHTVPRKPAGDVAPKRVVEARPTSKLDKNELLGLVGNMRMPAAPAVVPYDADAEVEIEKTDSADTTPVPSRSVANVEKRVVRTVARRTPIAGMAPIQVEPVAAPAVAPKPAATDEYIDLFAEGSDHSIDVASPAPPVSVEPVAPAPVQVAPAPAPAPEPSMPAAEPVAVAELPEPTRVGGRSDRTLHLAAIAAVVLLVLLLVVVLR